METRANYLLIGVFVLGVLGLLLGFIYWMGNDASGTQGKNYFVLFDGSVQGLTEASPVLFNGIRFGAVRSIEIVPEDTRKVRALISVRGDTPVRTNSRARIAQQGLAGWVAMEITPGTPEARMLEARTNEKYPVIFADPGSGGMMAGLSDVAGQANALMARLNNLVANNEESLTRTLNNVEAFSATLSEHKDDVGAFVQELRALTERLDKMAVKIDAAVDRVAGAASDNPDSVVSQVQQTAISFRQLAEKLDKSVGDRSAAITADAERDLRELELFLKDSRRLVDNLDHMVHKFEASPTGFLLGGQQSPKY